MISHRDPTLDYNYPELIDDPVCIICAQEPVFNEGDECESCEREWRLGAAFPRVTSEIALLAGEEDDDV